MKYYPLAGVYPSKILNRFKNVFDKIEKPIVKKYNYKKNNLQQNIKPIMTNIESLENLI